MNVSKEIDNYNKMIIGLIKKRRLYNKSVLDEIVIKSKNRYLLMFELDDYLAKLNHDEDAINIPSRCNLDGFDNLFDYEKSM